MAKRRIGVVGYGHLGNLCFGRCMFNDLSCAIMRKGAFGHIGTPKAQVRLCIRADWSRLSLSGYRIIGYCVVIHQCTTNAFLTHCRLNELSLTIYWTILILVFRYVRLCDLDTSREKIFIYLQTMETLIRRCVLQRLIWVCTVCQIPWLQWVRWLIRLEIRSRIFCPGG